LLSKPRIVFFDTEQSRRDTKGILDDVVRMTGLPPEEIDSHVALYSMRRVDREALLPLLRVAISDEKPAVVFLDGIVELVASFNDESESKQLIKELLVLSEENNCAIVNVLHTNKADDDHNMRGHLGTMLAQKAATVLECKKERGSSVITVSCSEARHEAMPDWSIMFTEDGLIVDADEQHKQILEQRKAEQQQKRQEASEKEKQERLDVCVRLVEENGGAISRKQLIEILIEKLERERSTVSNYITAWIKEEKLFEDNDKMIYTSKEQVLPF
jgi:hypothetical protein